MIRCAEKELFRLLVVFVNRPAVGPAQLDRMGNDSRQHGFEVERGADRLTHLSQRFQFSNRPSQLVGSRLKLLEKADVLNSDHGLVSEGSHEIDLLIRKTIDFVSPKGKYSNHSAVSQERHPQ